MVLNEPSFVVLVLLQAERVGFLRVVTEVVFVVVVLVGKMVWGVLITLSSKWLGTGFPLGTKPSAESFVRSRACF
jgi:hypothetical protein